MNDHQEGGESGTLKAGMGSTASSRSTFGPLQAPAFVTGRRNRDERNPGILEAPWP